MSLTASLQRHAFALVALAAVGFASLPATAGELIAVVNTQEIIAKSSAANALKEVANTKLKEWQNELKSKSTALNKEEEELSKQRSVLEQAVFENKVKDFRKKATDAQRDAQDKKAKIDKVLNAGFNEIQKAFLDIASKIAKEKGYKAVVTTSALVYADPSLDITAEALEKLNKQLPKANAKFE